MPQLTFNSIPLIFDMQMEAAEFCNRYQPVAEKILHGDFPFTATWQSNPNGSSTNIGLPVVNWPKAPSLKIGQLYWPCTGASRWAEGLFLCLGSQVTAIDSCATSSAGSNLVWSEASNPSENGVLGTEERGISWAEMWPVNYHRIAGCQTGREHDPDNILPSAGNHEYDLYAIHLVDRRWWWQFIDAPDICENLGSWTDLIDYLCTQLGIVAIFDPADLPLPSVYTTLGPHVDEWVRPYHNAAQLLDAALESIGARLVAGVDVLTGGPSIWKIHRASGAEAVFQNNVANNSVGFTNLRDQIAGTQCEFARNRAMPAYVRTLFPQSRYGMLCGTCSPTTPADITDDSDEDCHESYYPITHALSEYLDSNTHCPVQSTVKTIHVRGWADMGQCDDPAPMNSVELVALSNQIASDWFLYHRRQYDFTTVGPTAWDPCGYDDSIIHKFGVEYEDGQTAVAEASDDESSASDVIFQQSYRRDITSRIQSLPLNVGSDCQLHNTNALELPAKLLIKLNADIPALDCDYSEDNPGEVSGGLATAYRLKGWLGCGNLTPEKITAIDSAHLGEDYLVWVYNFDCEELQEGDCVLTDAHKCCARAAVERCHTGSSTMATAVDCILPGTNTGTATLESGETVTIDNTDCLVMAIPGDTFPVVFGGCAPTCTWRPVAQFGTTRWVRVWNTQAGAVSDTAQLCSGALGCCETREVLVLEDTTDADPGAPAAGSGGGDGCCTKAETACAITVCNTTNRQVAADCFYEDMLATLIPGKTCLWYLHDRRRATRLRGTLLMGMCGDSAVTGEPIKITTISVLDVCDWEPPTEPLEIFNPYNLYGCGGDVVECQWAENACRWEVVQVYHHIVDGFYTKIACSAGECAVKGTKLSAGLAIQQCESCGETMEETIIEGEEVDVPIGISVTYDDGSGGSGSDCPATAGGTLSITMPTKTICTLCPTGGEGGGLSDGTPITFPIEFKQVEALVGADFNCDPCPSLEVSTKNFYALCVDASETTYSPQECECVDCETDSSGGS